MLTQRERVQKALDRLVSNKPEIVAVLRVPGHYNLAMQTKHDIEVLEIARSNLVLESDPCAGCGNEGSDALFRNQLGSGNDLCHARGGT